ncbi:MAG TPA: DUF4249 family protein [Longimicrobium sp.]|nr:DUF4249 family protein [Longimicrobium sp.]
MKIAKILMPAGLTLLAGCTIADVSIPASEDRMVVEAVLRTDARMQFILLHRSVQGGASAGEAGAEVIVTRGDGLQITFRERTDIACYSIDPEYVGSEEGIEIQGSCYGSPNTAGRWVVPGQTYELSVRTARGEVARGRTTVPGDFTLRGVPVSRFNDHPPAECALPPRTLLPLAWTPAAGAWGYIAPMQIRGDALPDSFGVQQPVELIGISVSSSDTSLVLPSEFGVFERFDYDQDFLRLLQGGFPEGVSVRVVVAAADRNYINGVRGGSFNPSGLVRISSIVGDGVGVFGSLVPLSTAMVVGPTTADRPLCGS